MTRAPTEELSPLQQAVAEDLIGAVAAVHTAEVNPESDLADNDFVEYFGLRLGAYEALTGQRLNKQAFEKAFADALIQADHTVTKPESQTNAGHDLTVDGVRWSLKTEGAKQLRQGMIYISKFMEAAGVRHFKTTADALARVESIRQHLSRYERIIVLRSWPESHSELGECTRYEMVEIPKDLFDSLDGLTADDFSALTEAKTTRAPMRIGDKVVGMLRFDGSDEKVTLSRIRVDMCTRHATWWVPRVAGLSVD